MPDNWIGRILLTGETEVSIAGEKVHDLIKLNEAGGAIVPVDEENYPVLYDKVSIDSGVFLNMTRNTYSCTIPYRSLSGDWDIEFILSNISVPSQSYQALCTGDTSDTDKCEVWVNTGGAVIVILDWSAGHQAALGYIVFNSTIPQTLRIERRGDNQYSLYIDGVLTGSADWSSSSSKTWRVRSMGNSSTSRGDSIKFIKYSITNYSVPSNSSVYNLDEGSGNVIVDSVNGLNGTLTSGKYTWAPRFADLPNMTRPAGSPYPYKIIADKRPDGGYTGTGIEIISAGATPESADLLYAPHAVAAHGEYMATMTQYSTPDWDDYATVRIYKRDPLTFLYVEFQALTGFEWLTDIALFNDRLVIVGVDWDDTARIDFYDINLSSGMFEFTERIPTTALMVSNGNSADSVSMDADHLVVGYGGFKSSSWINGAVQIYNISGNVVTEGQAIAWEPVSDAHRFGRAVAINGDKLVVGNGDNNDDWVDVYIKSQTSGLFEYATKLNHTANSSYSYFGLSGIGMYGDPLVVGAFGDNAVLPDDGGSVVSGGQAHLYDWDSGTGEYIFRETFISTVPEYYAWFGRAVAITEDNVFVTTENSAAAVYKGDVHIFYQSHLQ